MCGFVRRFHQIVVNAPTGYYLNKIWSRETGGDQLCPGSRHSPLAHYSRHPSYYAYHSWKALLLRYSLGFLKWAKSYIFSTCTLAAYNTCIYLYWCYRRIIYEVYKRKRNVLPHGEIGLMSLSSETSSAVNKSIIYILLVKRMSPVQKEAVLTTSCTPFSLVRNIIIAMVDRSFCQTSRSTNEMTHIDVCLPRYIAL